MARNNGVTPRSPDAGDAASGVAAASGADAAGAGEDLRLDARGAGTLVKRKAAAKLLGVSESTVRRMEGSLLNPIIAEDGVHMFRAEEVVTMRQMRIGRQETATDFDGARAARVFALLDEGLHPIEIVKRTSIDPRAVTAIYNEWASMLGGFVVSERHIREFESILWLMAAYPMKSADGLVDALKHSGGSGDCMHCKTNPADYCATCVDRFTKAEQAKSLMAEREHAAEARRQHARERGAERAHVRAKRAEARRVAQPADAMPTRRERERADDGARREETDGQS